MSWIADNGMALFSLIFGAGGVGYGVITNILNRRKNRAEAKGLEADADVKGDAFWKARYDILAKEVQDKDTWWKDRYDNLKSEYDKERDRSNEILTGFRTELNDVRTDYEKRLAAEREAYDKLFQQYRDLQTSSEKSNREYLDRITELERKLSTYEKEMK